MTIKTVHVPELGRDVKYIVVVTEVPGDYNLYAITVPEFNASDNANQNDKVEGVVLRLVKEGTRRENTDLLKGMQCPNCGSMGPFEVCVRAWCVVHDHMVCEYTDPDWENGDHCACKACNLREPVSTFMKD